MKTLRMFFSAAVLVLTIVEFALPQSGWISTQLGTRNYVAVNFIDKNRGFIFGNDGLVFKTTDGGKVWNLANNFGAFLQNGLAVNENVICVRRLRHYFKNHHRRCPNRLFNYILRNSG